MALSRKKKNSLTLIVLLVLIVVSGIGYALISKSKGKEDLPEPAAVDLKLISIASDNIEKLVVKSENFSGTIVRSYEESNGEKKAVYSLQENAEFPLNQLKAENMFKYCVLEAGALITEDGKLSEYGLESAAIQIQVVSASGTSQSISIGDAVGMSDKTGNYVNVDGSSKVYLAKKEMVSAFSYDEADMIATESPKIDASNVTEVDITSTNGSFKFARDTEGVIRLYGLPYMNWLITDTKGRTYLAEDEKANQYVEDSFESIYLIRAVDYKSENFSKYGLAEPETYAVIYENIVDEDGNVTGQKVNKLFVGNKYSDDYYYIAFEGDSRTYLMSVTTLDNIFGLDVEEYLTKTFALMDMSKVACLEITRNGKTDVFGITTKTETDENNQTSTTISAVSKNGENLEDFTAFTGFYTIMAVEEWNACLKDDDSKGESILEVNYKKISGEYEDYCVNFENYNDNYCLIRINGTALYTISKTTVNSIISLVP